MPVADPVLSGDQVRHDERTLVYQVIVVFPDLFALNRNEVFTAPSGLNR